MVMYAHLLEYCKTITEKVSDVFEKSGQMLGCDNVKEENIQLCRHHDFLKKIHPKRARPCSWLVCVIGGWDCSGAPSPLECAQPSRLSSLCLSISHDWFRHCKALLGPPLTLRVTPLVYYPCPRTIFTRS